MEKGALGQLARERELRNNRKQQPAASASAPIAALRAGPDAAKGKDVITIGSDSEDDSGDFNRGFQADEAMARRLQDQQDQQDQRSLATSSFASWDDNGAAGASADEALARQLQQDDQCQYKRPLEDDAAVAARLDAELNGRPDAKRPRGSGMATGPSSQQQQPWPKRVEW